MVGVLVVDLCPEDVVPSVSFGVIPSKAWPDED